MYFWGGYAMQLYGYIPYKGGGIHLLAGLAPSRKTVGSILRTPWPAFPARKLLQKVIWQICFNGKMHSTTF